jgi:hypothetical protein
LLKYETEAALFDMRTCESAFSRRRIAHFLHGAQPKLLGGLTRRRSRQAAECRARRPSRLVLRETDGVTPLADAQRQHRVHRGKRRAARPLARQCGLQLNV